MSSNIAESVDCQGVNSYDYELIKYGGGGEAPCYIMAIDRKFDEKSADTKQRATVFGKYKTELCRNYERFETCKYGSKCLFAHGFSELRPTEVSVPPMGKLRRGAKKNNNGGFSESKMLCGAFMNYGYCVYGDLCKYRHHF